MRFAHTADCHIGGHRDQRLRALTEEAFGQFVSGAIDEQVDFVIIAGDLFNTAIPGIDTLRFAVSQLSRLREQGVPVYAIPGSHDFSPSGKTMLDVLHEAGLLHNVCRGTITDSGKLLLSFTIDKRTGAKITGVIGRRGMLDRQLYEELDHSIGDEHGEKIFLFHTALTELKPRELQEMESAPVSFLPRGFTYYAGGHVHIVERYAGLGYENVVYPGPLFPNSFSELERLRNGGYFMYDNGVVERREIRLRTVMPLTVSVDGMDANAANTAVQNLIGDINPTDAIVLLRIEGTIQSGSANDIDIRSAVRTLEERGAYVVLRNTARLSSTEFTSVQLRSDEPQAIEETLLREQASQLALPEGDGVQLARDLMRQLAREPLDGEKLHEYQGRIVDESLQRIERR